MSDTIPVLVLTGTVGVGKSSVLIEIHDVLANAHVPHGCLELDAVTYSWPPQGHFNETIALRNLACITSTFLEAGAERLVIARVIENAEDLNAYQTAIPNASLTVCRLVAPINIREARLRTRERGAGLDWHLQRTVELDSVLDQAGIEHFIVENGDRPLRDVALEVLRRAGLDSNSFVLGLLAAILVGYGTAVVTRPFKRNFQREYKCVGDVAKYLSVHRPQCFKRNWTKEEVAATVREIIVDETGVKDFTEDSDFIKDMHLD